MKKIVLGMIVFCTLHLVMCKGLCFLQYIIEPNDLSKEQGAFSPKRVCEDEDQTVTDLDQEDEDQTVTDKVVLLPMAHVLTKRFKEIMERNNHKGLILSCSDSESLARKLHYQRLRVGDVYVIVIGALDYTFDNQQSDDSDDEDQQITADKKEAIKAELLVAIYLNRTKIADSLGKSGLL